MPRRTLPAGALARAAPIVLAVALAACMESPASDEGSVAVPCAAASATATTSIWISGMQFLPFCAKVPAGAEVTFTNADSVDHTVTADAGQPEAFDSGRLYPGQQFVHAFSRAETVHVHCRLNPEVSGVVIVE